MEETSMKEMKCVVTWRAAKISKGVYLGYTKKWTNPCFVLIPGNSG